MDSDASYMQTLNVEVKTGFFWRDVCVEFIATFVLMSVQCALPLTWTSLDPNPGFGNIVQVGLGMGFVVCATAWTFGDFGGCHMNPAVTFAMVIAVKMTFLKGLFYMISQCAGALAGAGFIYALTPDGNRDTLAATALHPDLKAWQGVLVEIWLTFLLVCTIFGATNARRKGHIYMPTIVIGFAVTVGVLSGSAYTGGSMNPARSLGPAVVMGLWDNHWIYWVGPLAGAALAALIYHYVLDRIGHIPDIHHTEKTIASIKLETRVDKKDASYENGAFNGEMRQSSTAELNNEYM